MKYAPFLLAGSAIGAGIVGFFLLAGAPGLLFRCVAAGLVIATSLVTLNRQNIKRPVRSTFAASFKSESD